MKTTTKEAVFVRKQELAELLGVSGRTIDTWIALKLIPFVAVSRRLHLFDVDAVREALAGRFGVAAGEERPQ